MSGALRVLLVEDSEDDAELLLRELRRGGHDPRWSRVDTPEAFASALVEDKWDAIFADYSMPRFSAPEAFAMVKARGLDVPFIIVSGTVGEEAAVAAMKSGVHDYLLKDKLARLVPVVERELREAVVRAEGRKMQERLMISDRMASMGTLAAGVAHEINNPLASVMANLELAVQGMGELAAQVGASPNLDVIEEELQDAREGAERIRNIVRDLKIFSRSGEDRKGLVDVQRILESTTRMAWNEIRHRGRLVKNYSPAPLVEASEAQLGQLFLNLVVNAAQSIPEGDAEHNQVRVSLSTDAAGMAVVEISDTGAGMPKEVQDQLYRPFFTTKPIGIGTGLGLAICHQIVDELHGHMEFWSEVGRGTSFKIVLPPAREEARDAPKVDNLAELAARRRGRVLVVDDEPLITRTVQRALSKDHDILALSSAEEALAHIAKGERFDVILCDLMMPQMTGMDLYAELLRVAEDQAARMIFLTGGAFTPRARAFIDGTSNQLIEKPFDAIHLRAIINAQVR
ncbi:MAG TPA: response regulator [Kofleriaceae bacterium]|nr:response regulator [Kofleriaceae bacterium]